MQVNKYGNFKRGEVESPKDSSIERVRQDDMLVEEHRGMLTQMNR